MSEFLPDIKPCAHCGAMPEPLRRSTGKGHGESYNDVGVKCSNCSICAVIGGYTGYEEDIRLLKAIRNWNAHT